MLGSGPDRTPEHELAWAAGFYGGDGTTSAGLNIAGGPGYRTLKAGIPQAALEGGVPPVLTRFHAAVGGAGAVRGPYVLKNPWSRLPQFVWSISGIRGVEPLLCNENAGVEDQGVKVRWLAADDGDNVVLSFDEFVIIQVGGG